MTISIKYSEGTYSSKITYYIRANYLATTKIPYQEKIYNNKLRTNYKNVTKSF